MLPFRTSGCRFPVFASLLVLLFTAACGQKPAAAPTPTAFVAPTVSVSPAPTSTIAPTAGATPIKPAKAVAAPTTIPAPPTAVPPPAATRLEIPSIGVNAVIEDVGLTADGAMDVPKKWEDVGWYDLGPQPGQPGNAVIAGHLDSDVAPAVFWRLNDLRPGDRLIVDRADHTQLTFVVTAKRQYAYNDAAAIPMVFGSAQTANLNLITCGGVFNRSAKNYSNRLVVFATLAKAS